MMTEYKIKEILRFHNGRGYDSISEHGLIPVYGSGGVMGYTDKSLLEGEYILLPRKGSLNNYFYINKPFWNVDTIYAADVMRDDIDCKYLYYYFKCLNLGNLDSGSTLPSMTQSAYGSIKVKLPSRDTQKTVAKFLTTIDDKISVNNKIIETSEKLMREIYDYWFVQFDFPDENGRPYKSSGGEMIYDETLKREIPKGWSVVQLRDIADVKSGFSFSSDDYISDGEYKIITIKNVQDGFIDYDTDNTIDFIPHKMPAWCKLGSSEILMSLTGNTGRIGLTFGEQALLNQRVAKIEPKDKATNPFLYVLLGSDSVQNKIQGLSSGSSQKNLSPIQLSNIYVAYSEEYSDKMSELLAPSVDIIVQKYSENRKLASLRDWLLPMLMNGQIKVSD